MKRFTLLILTLIISKVSYGQIDSLKSLDHIRNHFLTMYKDADFNQECQKCYDCIEILKRDSIDRKDTNEYFQSRTAGGCIALQKYKELVNLDKKLLQLLKKNTKDYVSIQQKWLENLDVKIELIRQNSEYTRAGHLIEHLEFAIDEYKNRIEENNK